ncbi:MAG: hypothetical protein ABIU05_12440 [Nitrospirales bacterium]
MHLVFPLIFAMLISGCLGSRVADVRATEPRLIGNFPVPHEQLATCTQERLEEDSLSLGQPYALPARIQLTHEQAGTLIHVYAIEGRSTLFDVTFERLYSGATLVEYRRSYEGVGSQQHAWAIVEGCAQRMRGIEQSYRPCHPAFSRPSCLRFQSPAWTPSGATERQGMLEEARAARAPHTTVGDPCKECGAETSGVY